MKIIDISHLDVNTLDYVENKANTLVYRKINKAEIRNPVGNNKLPWFNDVGSLEFSLSFETKRIPAIALMICAYSLAEMIEGKIKWPNDVILDNKKIAGMMIIKKDKSLVLGASINLNRKIFNHEIKDKAISYINHFGKKWDEDKFIIEYWNKLKINLAKISIKEIEAKQIFKNKKMNFNNDVYEFISINRDGSSLWLVNGQKKIFFSGDLSFNKHYDLFSK